MGLQNRARSRNAEFWKDARRSLAVVVLVVISGGCASPPAEPPGEATPELAVQAIISERLGMPVVLQIETSGIHGEWAFLAGLPLTTAGGRIDYADTPYASALAGGYFDDNFAALVRRSVGAPADWKVVELSIGATDAPFVDWLAEYGLPMTLVSP